MNMNVILITQNDNYYLPKNIDYLIYNLPDGIKITSAIVLDVSPFGKKLNIFQKAFSTYNIFGFKFFCRYSFKFIFNKLFNDDVKSTIDKNNIKSLNIKGNINGKLNLELIASEKPDIIISIACNQIFKKALIQIPKIGIINLHTSLLPKYRGLMPSFWVLKNMESITGVSVFFVDEGIDSGDIIVQKIIKIETRNLEKLVKLTKETGIKAIIEALRKILSNSYDTIDNNENLMTYNGFPTKNDVRSFLSSGNKFY